MGILKCVLLLGVLGAASANVMIASKFIEKFGWKVTLSWSPTLPDEKLQNLTIWRNDEQIILFKPQENNILMHNITNKNATMSIKCELETKSQSGNCVVLVDVKQNASDDTYKALEFWGPPTWERIKSEETVIDKATNSMIRETQKPGQRQVLNCSSEGVPSPVLVWTIGKGKDAKVIPADFNHTSWNETTKRWHSWSVFRPGVGGKSFSIACTPMQVIKNGIVETGLPKIVSVNSGGKFEIANFLMAALLIIILVTHSNIL